MIVINGCIRVRNGQVERMQGRWVFPSREIGSDPPRVRLLRIFVDLDRTPAEVVTVYRTSQLAKHWRRRP